MIFLTGNMMLLWQTVHVGFFFGVNHSQGSLQTSDCPGAADPREGQKVPHLKVGNKQKTLDQ